MRFFRDKRGMRAADTSDVSGTLGHFLVSDVQDSEYTCAELLNAIESIRTGKEVDYEETGNAYCVSITESRVILQDLFVPGSTEEALSLDCFENAIRGWLAFLKNPNREWTDSAF